MVVGTLRILPSANRRSDVVEILKSIQGPVRVEAGCTGCDIYEELGPDHAIVLIERFESSEALYAHLRSEAYRNILGALELSQGTPNVLFEHVSAREGIELIQRHRLARASSSSKGDAS